MQLDPSRWLVSFAGFIYDWIITREWKRILFSLFPLFLAVAVAGTVFWGSRRDKLALATWYMELGNEEIQEWENAWAPTEATDLAVESVGGEPNTDQLDSGADLAAGDSVADDKSKARVSRFAEALFRRVQLLAPSDRSQFVIGTTLAQRGALAQAEQMLTQIAPNEGVGGYAPAHAVLAQLFMPRVQMDQRKYLPMVMHHLTEGARWDRVPIATLQLAAELFARLGKTGEALNFQDMAAQRDPANNVGLAKLAGLLGNRKMAERAGKAAEEYLRGRIDENPKDTKSRITLATYLVDSGRLDDADAVLFPKIPDLERTPELARAQSQLYRIKFQNNIKVVGSQSTLEMGLLDQAMKLDPTNPFIAQDVANLARNGVASASPELLDTLRNFLAEGTATTATHAMLAETYLIRENYARALPHLEQLVIRMPNQPDYLNNLAFVLADLHPDRLEEALGYATRAVAAAAANQARNADFYDTFSTVLAKLDRDKEALAAIETAIELRPSSVEFHRQAAGLYRKTQNVEMANVHEKIAQRLVDEADSTAPAPNAEGPPK